MPDTWGLLPKSQVDDETIEEAINRIVQEHNEDETAHLGAGQSLQSHKTSEIIDHVVASIITDKIADFAVDISKIAQFNKKLFHASLETKDCWTVTGGGGLDVNAGEFDFHTGNVLNSYIEAIANPGLLVHFNKKSIFQAVFQMIIYGNMEMYIIAGTRLKDEPEDQAYGFKIVNTTIYAFHSKTNGSSTTEYTTAIATLSDHVDHVYRAEFDPATGIKFYIDGVLLATHTTNLPDSNYIGGTVCNLYLKTTAAATKGGYLHQVHFEEEL